MSKFTYTTILLATILAASIFFAVMSLVTIHNNPAAQATSLVAVVPCAALFVAHLRRWRWVPEALVVTLTILTVVSAPPDFIKNNLFIAGMVPCVIAAALLTPMWAFGSFVVSLFGVLLFNGIRTGTFDRATLGPTVSTTNFIMLAMIAIGVTVASSIARSAQHTSQQNARNAEEERDRAEMQSRTVAEVNSQLNEQVEQQRQLLELVATLETTTVQIANGILLAPIVGHMDSRRAQAITARLLKEVNAQRARLVILDVSGVSVMDTAVAQAMLGTARALRLLGCDVAISGISASVAMTLTDLGIGMENIKTVRSPQEALALFAPAERSLNGKVALA